MYYQQPQPQQPKKNSPFLWVGIGCAGLLIACIGCAAFGGLVGGGTSSIVNAASTATDGPTATAQSTLTPLQSLQDVARHNSDTSWALTATFDKGIVVVKMDTTGNYVSKITVEEQIFRVQMAIWTQWHGNASEANVDVFGPLQDNLGNRITGLYAHSMLRRATAAKIQWDNLDYDLATGAYDVWLIRQDI